MKWRAMSVSKLLMSTYATNVPCSVVDMLTDISKRAEYL